MDKNIKTLEQLEKALIEDDNLPLMDANLVFGEGNPNANVLFIGEAPGFYEDREGRPFVGRAGKLLDKLIDAIEWKREDVYITNIVKRRPPENRDPTPDEIASYTPYLTKQIEIISPKIIVPLGRFAMNYFLPAAKISRDQGKLFWWKDYLVVPVYHPAAALRNGTVLEKLKKSFVKLPLVVKKFDDFVKDRGLANSEEENDVSEQKSLF